MELLPFSISYDNDLNTIYTFLFTSDQPSRQTPYETVIKIDELNDSLIVFKECSCKGNWQYKKECKHLKMAKEKLKSFKIDFREAQ